MACRERMGLVYLAFETGINPSVRGRIANGFREDSPETRQKTWVVLGNKEYEVFQIQMCFTFWHIAL